MDDAVTHQAKDGGAIGFDNVLRERLLQGDANGKS